MQRVADLAEVGAGAEAVFGGKARGLARLIAAGARVPPGFAVEATTLAPEAWPEQALGEFSRRVSVLLRDGPVAVRSSAVGEDAAERSFAGMFETALGITDAERALEAAARSIASGGSERVRAYAGVPSALPVGLVVQSQASARAAGVCFTLDPAGRDGAVVLEAVAGTGDALMSGHAAPERWRVYRSGLGTWEPHRDTRSAVRVLAAEEAAAIAGEATALAERFGHPLDLEWALDGGGPWWLQARPITAAAAPPAFVVERAFEGADDGPVSVWSNWNVRETMPDPFTPLNWGLWRDVVLPIVGEDIVGVPRDSPLARHLCGIDLVHGRIYWNMNAMLAWPFGRFFLRSLAVIDARAGEVLAPLAAAGVLVPRRLPGSRARVTLGMLWVSLRTLARIGSALRPGRALATLAACGRQISRRADVSAMSDAELLREMRLLQAPESLGLRRAQQMLATAVLVYGAADRAFRDHPEARRLLPAGLVGPTTEISLGVDDLVEAARALAAAFRDPLPARERLARIEATPGGAEWLARFRDFLDRFGQRGPKEFDIAAPRWADDPTMILELVRAGLASSGGERLAERLARLAHQRRKAIEAAAAAASWWRRPLLRGLASMVERYMPLREAPKHYAMFVFQRMRRVALELGARLVTRGVLEAAEDVFFVEWPELQALFRGEAGAKDYRGLVRERRGRFERFAREKPPDFLRSDGVPVVDETETGAPADGVLRGTGASPGSVSGPVRILREPDPGAMADGDVIVVEFADPGWTPLFPRSAAPPQPKDDAAEPRSLEFRVKSREFMRAS